MSETNRHEVDLVDKPFDRWIRALGTSATVLTAIAVFTGVWFGFREVSALSNQLELQTEQLRLQRVALEEEWKQKFFDNQIEIYSEVAAVAGKIAALGNAASDEDRAKYKLEFSALFWGKMCIVEGADVEQAMIFFKRGLDKNIKSEKLEQLAVNLVHVCRNETKQRYFPAEQPKAELDDNNQIIARMQKIADGE